MVPEFGRLHEISRHAIHVSETLEVASRSFKALVESRADVVSRFRASDEVQMTDVTDVLTLMQQALENLRSRSEANKARVDNEITLVSCTSQVLVEY